MRHQAFNNLCFLRQKPNKLALPVDLYSHSPLRFFQAAVFSLYFSSFLRFHLHIFKALQKNGSGLKGYYRYICYLNNNRTDFSLEQQKKRGYFSSKKDLKGCHVIHVLWLTEFVLQFVVASALVRSFLLQK